MYLLAVVVKMHRILTHTGIVDITDDHSLLTINGNEISPKDVQLGTELLHKTMINHTSIDNNEMDIFKAKIYGFFFGDGSCGIYNCLRSFTKFHEYLRIFTKLYEALRIFFSIVTKFIALSIMITLEI